MSSAGIISKVMEVGLPSINTCGLDPRICTFPSTSTLKPGMFFITSTAEAPWVVRSLSTLYTLRSTCITEVRFSPVTSNSFRISASGCNTTLPRSRSIRSRESVTVTTWAL